MDEPHEPLKVSGVEIMLRAVGKDAGLSVHPHTLRHSFASHMIEQGVPINYVQSMLGHRCLESTQVGLGIAILLFAIIISLCSSGMGLLVIGIGIVGLIFSIIGFMERK